MTALACVLVLIGSLIAAEAQAQTKVVKQRLPDGSVLYSDQKVVGAKVEGVIEAPAVAPVARTLSPDALPPRVAHLPGASVLTLPPLPPLHGVAERDGSGGAESAADDRARKALEEALAAQVAGAAPQEGDRIRTAKGRMRFSESYTKRQAALAKDVDDARAALKTQRR